MATIGILGAGKSGTSLARAALRAGDEVRIAGSGHPDRIRLIVDVLVPGAVAVAAPDVVRGADLVALAVPMHRFGAVDPRPLDGRTVIDLMNYWEPIDGDVPAFDEAPDGTSVLVQRALPGALVVKSLNHLGYHELEEDARPAGDAHRRAVGAAGDDRDAVASVLRLIDRIGFDPVDAGELANGVAFQPGSPLFGAHFGAGEFRDVLDRVLLEQRRAA